MAFRAPKLGEMRWTVQVVRRVMNAPAPFSAEVDHTYTPVLTTRAKMETKQGVNEFNRVTIGDQTVTHTFTMRYSTIVIDGRDRLKDTLGNLFAILAVETPVWGRWTVLHCEQIGSIDRPSVA